MIIVIIFIIIIIIIIITYVIVIVIMIINMMVMMHYIACNYQNKDISDKHNVHHGSILLKVKMINTNVLEMCIISNSIHIGLHNLHNRRITL